MNEKTATVPPEDKKEKPKPNPAALVAIGEKGIELRSLEELIKFAQLAVEHGAAPKGMSYGAAALCIQTGLERGLGLMGGLQQVYPVNGVLAWRGQAAVALIRNSGLCKPGTLKFGCEGKGENMKGFCEAWRVGDEELTRIEFTYEDARKAGLINKDNWKSYPKRQYMWRAVGFLAKDKFSDVLGGFPIDEEARDYEAIISEKPPIISRPELPATTVPDTLLEALDIAPQPKVKEEPVEVKPEKKSEPEKQEPKQTALACKHGNLGSGFCKECSMEADAAIAGG